MDSTLVNQTDGFLCEHLLRVEWLERCWKVETSFLNLYPSIFTFPINNSGHPKIRSLHPIAFSKKFTGISSVSGVTELNWINSLDINYFSICIWSIFVARYALLIEWKRGEWNWLFTFCVCVCLCACVFLSDARSIELQCTVVSR